jgi:hypothetical protein
MPPVYRWRMRSKIYRWYAQLEAIDREIAQGVTSSDVENARGRWDELEKHVSGISVPLSFREEPYDLRLHIQMLRNKPANR